MSGAGASTKAENALEAVRSKREEAEEKLGTPDFTKRVACWRVDVTDPLDGKRYDGAFRSQMPSLAQRDEMALTVARLSGGLPWQSLPPQLRDRLQMYATFAVCLTDVPDWFRQYDSFFSDTVPAAVYGRVLEHFRTFFRPAERAGGGPAEPAGQPAPAL